MRRLLVSLIACLLALSAWAVSPHSAWGFDKPELLPDTQTPVIDLADFIPSVQEESLVEDLESFEAETGWKLRVLTQYYQTPGRAVKEFWGLDDKSILLVADSRGNNLLAFNVGDDIYQLLPRTFWVELQTRYGNLYFVDDNGKNSAIIQSIETIKNCLRESGCSVVPGLPREQWILTLITSVVGGLVLGFAGTPRKEGQAFAWQWALIFSPLWGILFIAFGIGPVVTRTSEWLPLFRNVLGFMFGILVAYLLPILNRSPNSEET